MLASALPRPIQPPSAWPCSQWHGEQPALRRLAALPGTVSYQERGKDGNGECSFSSVLLTSSSHPTLSKIWGETEITFILPEIQKVSHKPPM